MRLDACIGVNRNSRLDMRPSGTTHLICVSKYCQVGLGGPGNEINREEFSMLFKTIAGAGLALALGASVPAFADVTVHLLHVNQNNDPLWKAIAAAYNKSHPGHDDRRRLS